VLCEAAGFDTVLVETVGVGQSETAAHSMVDFFLLLQVTGTGDELQGIKRGIMEMADGIAINKCDCNNIDKARVARTQFKNALALFPPHESGWKPTAVTCSSVEGNCIDDVWKMIEDYMVFTKRNGYFRKKRTEQSKYWMYETIILCEAAGFDKIFVETVGVGQSETACHSMVDFFLLIQVAGTGDELQGIKRGIMEISDGIVINKCDGDNVDRCQMAATNFRNALHFFPMPESGWTPKVLCYSGFYGTGVKEVWDMIYQYVDFVKQNGYFDYRRNEQSKYWMYESINEHLRLNFYNNPVIKSQLSAAEQTVLAGQKTSFVAAQDLLDEYFNALKA
jgi:putative protein kinase ArgK-like GTPase of G3E family